MILLLIALAHAVPTCVQASTECAPQLGPCLFVQNATDPSCVNWDVDSGAIVVMPGATADVVLQQDTLLETLHVGVERAQLPQALQDWLVDDPFGGPGPTTVTVDANGYDLAIGPATVGEIHPVKVVNATLTIDGAKIVGQDFESCVYAYQSDLTIQGGSIASCSADLGAGIYAQGGDLTVEGTSFLANYAELGGDVWTDGTLTLMNTDHSLFDASERGGSVYFEGSDATIDGSTFSDGSAALRGGTVFVADGATGTTHVVRTDMSSSSADYGGAIAVANGSEASLVVEDSTFSDTWSSFEGGAIHLDSDSAGATVSHSSFSGNQARVGGAIAARSDLELWSSRIEDTLGWVAGGAVAATDDASVDIVNSGFLRSESNDGGALYLENVGSATIEGSWFCDTNAWYGGGAVYLDNSTDDVLVRHTLFQRTTAPWGSVWSHQASGSVLMENVAAIDFIFAPLEDDAELVSVQQSVLHRDGTWNTGRYAGNAVFAAGDQPELLHGAAPSPCGEPFLLHPINDPAHEGPEDIYDATGVWSMEGNFGPFGADANESVATDAGLLDPLYVDITADSTTGARPPAADWYGDGDGDGFPTMLDCDDADASVHPGVVERCNGIDDDCTGFANDADAQAWLPDPDGDGHVEKDAVAEDGCVPEGIGIVLVEDVQGLDCDETDPLVNSSADEVCGDQIDNDCNADTDDMAEAERYFPDVDGDGFGDWTSDGMMQCPEMVADEPLATNDLDCDDGDGAIKPGVPEIVDNGVDEDCDGVDATSFAAGGCQVAPSGGSVSLWSRRR